MTTVNHLKVLLLLIGCLLFCISIQCSETPKAVSAQTSTSVETPTATENRAVTEWQREHIKYISNDLDEDKDEKEKNDDKNEKDKNENRSEPENENEDWKNRGPEHNNNGDNDHNEGQRRHNFSRTDSTPSSTIVTTIIVVTTEVPTIYTGTTDPGQQKGSGETDPNTTDNSNPSPSETAIDGKLLAGRDAYRRLVLALSIVGGIAGMALFVGAFIFTRMRGRKRKRKQALDLENAHNNDSTPPSSPKLPLPAHYRTSSVRSEDGEMTIIDFNHDPFQDPSNSSPYYKDSMSSQNRFNMSPSEPSSRPERSHHIFRQNHTLSMLSQTTSAALPSAPTAKELDSVNYENSLDDRRSDLVSFNEALHLHDTPMSSTNVKNIPSPQQASLLQGTRELSPDLPPPPAYTVRAVPSAPPLYALPTNARALDSQHNEDPSRRHSISSCSMASSTRPISLRRGSGSHAHISSIFS